MPYVKAVCDGQTVVYISVVSVVYSTALEVCVGQLMVCEDVTVVSIHVGSEIITAWPLIVAIVLDEKQVLIITGCSTIV